MTRDFLPTQENECRSAISGGARVRRLAMVISVSAYVEIPPEKMDRYRAHLRDFDVEPEKRDEAIRALHVILTCLIDIAWGTSDVQLVEKARLTETFLAESAGRSIVSKADFADKIPKSANQKSHKKENRKARHDLA